jgi:hypothetical protein
VNYIEWVVLGVIAEGCCDALRQGLAEILPSLLLSVQDQESYVRECACFALGDTEIRAAHVMIIMHHYYELALVGRSKYSLTNLEFVIRRPNPFIASSFRPA